MPTTSSKPVLSPGAAALGRFGLGETLSAEAEAELARKLTLVAMVRLAAVTATLIVLFSYTQTRAVQEDSVELWQYSLIGLTYGLSIVYALALRLRRWIVPLAYVQVALDSLVVTTVVMMTGGVESIFASVYVFTVLGAASTLHRPGAVLAAASANLMFGSVVLLQLYGHLRLLPAVRTEVALFSYFLYAGGIVMVAVLSSALAEKLRVTGRRLKEKESDYEQLEELHASILSSLPAGLLTVDPAGLVRYANEAALAILRAPPERVLGVPLGEAVPCMREPWERWAQRERSAEIRERYEASHTRPDGKGVRLGFSFAPLGGREAHSMAVFQDVTEIVRLKDAYERAERLATVGRLAAGLAHEVRNPLASMCASIEVLQGTLEPAEPMKKLMKNVVREADRLNALITDFLQFARPRELKRTHADLQELVSGLVEVVRNDPLVSRHRLVERLEAALPVSVDADQLRQVLWNIIKNAAEAMGTEPGVLTVEARARGEQVEVLVRDTGPGMNDETRRRIFAPFYTTKERGTGLGLAIAHAIVEAHGGRIFVDSAPGQGTEVVVSLPRAGSADPPAVVERARVGTTDLEIIGGA